MFNNAPLFRCVIMLLVVVSSIPFPASGQEDEPVLVRSDMPSWSQWRGPRRDGISEETGLLTHWPEGGPTRLWTAAGIGRGYSSVVVGGETVFITGDEGDDLIISAFSLDGKLQWQRKNGAAWKRSFPGARSSCTFDKGKLYHMNAHGRLMCLDASSGAEVWAVNVLERFEGKNITWGISESLAILDDMVFATPCGAKGLIVALNKGTGDTVWVTPALEDERASYASPILVRSGERVLIINCAIKNAFAVDARTGELCWSVPQEDPSNTVTTIPVLTGNVVLFTNASRSYGAAFGVRLDGTRGEKTWVKELTISHGSTVGLAGQIYGASSRGVARGWLAIDAQTGSIRVASELRGGSLIYADGLFYCLTQQGTMTLQKPTADGFETVGSFAIAEGQRDVWAHPVICDGRLYLRVHDTLSCYDIRR
jgi:outer membrane protein assembly factor BamB